MAPRVAPGPSGLGHLGWPTLSKRYAERVLKIVRGQSGGDCQRDADILREAAVSVQWIKRKTAATQSPGQRKKELTHAATKIEAAIKSIKDLPIATQYEIDPEALRSTPKLTPLPGYDYGAQREFQQGILQRLHDRIDALAEKIIVKRHSGGKQRGPGGGRIEAAQKRAAADCAINILLTWGSKVPTLTAGGTYYKLTAMLFKLATENVGDVDVEGACTRVYKELLGSPDEVDQMQREGRLWSKVSSRSFEMYEMIFEDVDLPKVFEDRD
jgi:hypothetical protein